jgi:anaerobic selenocysteine-containing dehydrogenase
MPNVYNSSGRDIAALHRGRPYNPAYLHPDDLAELGVVEGDVVRIESDRASILGVAAAAPELRRGVLSMAHGFGDAPERDGELWRIGSNTGRLVDGERGADPYTGIPRMSAVPVSIQRVDAGLADGTER